MGLRKLTDKPGSNIDTKTADRRPSDADRNGASAREPQDSGLDKLMSPVATDLKTPPPSHNEFQDEAAEILIVPPVVQIAETPASTKAEAPASPAQPTASDTTDSFMAALEALRATLRQPPPAPSKDSKLDIVIDEAPSPIPTPVAIKAALEEDDEPKPRPLPALVPAPIKHEESTSALERMPLPPPIDGPSQTPRPLYEDPLLKNQRRKSTSTPAPVIARETPTMDNALEAVRNAVPGIRLTPPKSDTPTNGRERPLSDGIPKSISEDLPKYQARPKMRICGRCGHETKLRNTKCEKCAHVDESLGILDAVIAGDLARVEQVLLVRPNLITLRTSRHEWTLLHMAASGGNPKMVELLLAKGASVNAVNRDGKTALHYAAGKGHLAIVKTLLEQFADPTMLYNGRSALDLARKAGHREVAEVIRAVMPEGNPDAIHED